MSLPKRTPLSSVSPGMLVVDKANPISIGNICYSKGTGTLADRQMEIIRLLPYMC